MRIVILLFVSIFLSSCLVTYNDFTSSTITKLAEVKCKNPANQIGLYFEGEPIRFQYEKIGLVEAKGAPNASNGNVLDHLKFAAWTNCANAIINIKQGYKNEQTGLIFDSQTQKRNFSATVFSGLAVRIISDSIPLQTDTLFATRVRKELNSEDNQYTTQVIVSLLLGISAVVACIYLILNQ